uniref:Uncharacterized protein n=1 Tax=viral metagenome TaxID=1070528 RepID=A0A6M3JQI4_9ZZZZ
MNEELIEKCRLTDEEIREELKRYFTDEQMLMPEETHDIVCGVIAVVRKKQLAKAIPLISAEARKQVAQDILDIVDREPYMAFDQITEIRFKCQGIIKSQALKEGGKEAE